MWTSWPSIQGSEEELDIYPTEIQHVQLSKNMESIWALKKNVCKFGSLLICLFFFVQKLFPSKGNIVWSKDRPITYHINELGESFDGRMDVYFENFKDKMHNRFIIPK